MWRHFTFYSIKNTKGSFYATYSCAVAKKEKKVWGPKKQAPAAVRQPSHPVHKDNGFDKTIRRPSSKPKIKSKEGVVRLSNSFEAIGSSGLVAENEEGPSLRSPTTLLEVLRRL